jgi:hypothetical protein
LDFACEFQPDSYDIESIAIDKATGKLWVQLQHPPGAFQSTSTCIFEVDTSLPGNPVTVINPNTGFGINGRGTDMHFDPATGLLITQDQNTAPLKRIATQVPVPFGPTGTHCFVTPPVFDGAGTFGGDFSAGIGGSDVAPGDFVFTTDVSGNGIHSCTFGGGGTTTHALGGAALLPGDDMVIQPDGDWIHIGDFMRPITRFLPSAGHAGFPSALNIQTIFNDAGRPFVHGSRATVCDITGEIYISYSGSPGGSAIFRIDEALTTATHVVDIIDDEGLQDLTLGPSSSGAGKSVYFTVHDQDLIGGTTPEEVWELTVPECACDADPLTQGYWHRQCLGVPAADGGIDPGRNGRGPQSPTEPGFDKLMPEVSLLLQNKLAEFGGSCAAGMDADPPSNPCERATKQFTALLFNQASGRLQAGCEIDVSVQGCSATTVTGLVDELAALIISGDSDSCKLAADCAAAVNEGTALVESAAVPAAPASTAVPEPTVSYAAAGAGAVPSAAATPEAITEPSPEPSPYVRLVDSTSAMPSTAAPEVHVEQVKEEAPIDVDDGLQTIHRHLAVLANHSATEKTLAISTDILLTALSGGYEPEVRIEIVKGLLDKADVSLISLLAEHVRDIRDEARDFDRRDLAEEAEKILNRLEPSEE